MMLFLLLIHLALAQPTYSDILAQSKPSYGILSSEGCLINPDSREEWPGTPPILTSQAGDFILPIGEEGARQFLLTYDQVFLIGCPGSMFTNHDATLLYGQCKGGVYEMRLPDGGDPWVEESLGEYGCEHQPHDTTQEIGTCGPAGEGTEIQIEFDISQNMEGEAVTITVCHDLTQSRTLWSRHTVWDEVSASDHGNNRPAFSTDGLFDFDVNNAYKMATQRETVKDLVGSRELADKYIQDQSTNKFLARGHLAPNGDFIFYSWMDSSFHFINVAPQWQCFNGFNWNYFESGCRNFAVERELDLVVYTGTSGVLQLLDVDNELVDIFLYDGYRLPVPRYYWKILYDPVGGSGVAVIGINNPHLESVPESYIVCPPLADHPILSGVSDQSSIYRGYIWACRVEDLAAAIPEVPELPAMELLK